MEINSNRNQGKMILENDMESGVLAYLTTNGNSNYDSIKKHLKKNYGYELAHPELFERIMTRTGLVKKEGDLYKLSYK